MHDYYLEVELALMLSFQLTQELEKKFSDCHVVFIAVSNISS